MLNVHNAPALNKKQLEDLFHHNIIFCWEMCQINQHSLHVSADDLIYCNSDCLQKDYDCFRDVHESGLCVSNADIFFVHGRKCKLGRIMTLNGKQATGMMVSSSNAHSETLKHKPFPCLMFLFLQQIIRQSLGFFCTTGTQKQDRTRPASLTPAWNTPSLPNLQLIHGRWVVQIGLKPGPTKLSAFL